MAEPRDNRCPRPRLARRALRASIAPAGLLLAGGCSGERTQSALHPAGPAAAEIAQLWWVLCAVCTGVFVVVMLLLLVALLKGRQGDRSSAALGGTFIVISGMLIPGLILAALMVYTLETIFSLRASGAAAEEPLDEGEAPLVIRVVGHLWWWEVLYPEQGIITANELHIPAGRPVRIELATHDVIHSFWVPQLHGKMDMVPEGTNRFWIQADRPGVYRGQCAEYCGTQHALMAFEVIALEPDEFRDWLVRQQQPRAAPEDAAVARGQEVFFEAKCHNCHAIAGTPAVGRIGPDLTDLASRRTLGAGTIANNTGNLTGWISNPQALKPGNRMPRTYLTSEELHALRAYLESLQ